MARYEKPLSGNPHQLTIKQHVLPAASIARFSGSDGRVQVFLKKVGKSVSLPPHNSVFCALRAWDQKTESGFMAGVEREFQSLASALQVGLVSSVPQDKQRAVSKFYSLFCERAYRRDNPAPTARINAIGVGRELTQDDQEYLEKHGVLPIRPDLTIAGHQMAGPLFPLRVDDRVRQLGNRKWGVLISTCGEFLVSDTPGSFGIVPILPTLALALDAGDRLVEPNELLMVNRDMRDAATICYFARDLSRCPL